MSAPQREYGVTNATPDGRWTWTRQSAPGTMTLAEAKAEAKRLNGGWRYWLVGTSLDTGTTIHAPTMADAFAIARKRGAKERDLTCYGSSLTATVTPGRMQVGPDGKANDSEYDEPDEPYPGAWV